MHGPLFLRSLTPSLPSLRTQPASHSSHRAWSVWSAPSVNEARKLMFTVGLRPLEFIPTTQHALLQHTKRALPMTDFIWIRVGSKHLTFQTQVNGIGNEMTEQRHRGPVCQMPANYAQCFSTVAAWLLARQTCKCHQAGLYRCPLCKCEGGCANSASN